MGEGADIGLLHHILGIGVVTQAAARQPVKPAIVGLHDLAQRSLVAAAGALDQLGLRCPGAGGQAGCGPLHGSPLRISPWFRTLDAARQERLLTFSPSASPSRSE